MAALDGGRVDVRRAVDDLGPVGAIAALDEQALEQLVRAFEAVLREALTGGREQRELVLQAAVPAIVANGAGLLDLIEAQVAVFVSVSAAVLEAVDPGERPAARVWLARYAGDYVREVAEVAERARDAEREAPA